MKEQELLKAMGEIREEFILEADPQTEAVRAKVIPWRTYGRGLGVLAAALVLIAGIGIYQNLHQDLKSEVTPVSMEEATDVAEDAINENFTDSGSIPGSLSDETMKAESISNSASSAQANMRNPWIPCASLAEAEKIAGFSLAVPEADAAFPQEEIYAEEAQVIEVRYLDADGNEGYRIRKGIHTESLDGDYNEYDTEWTIHVGDLEVTLKGNGSRIFVVKWKQEEYSFSITADQAVFSEKEIRELVKAIA